MGHNALELNLCVILFSDCRGKNTEANPNFAIYKPCAKCQYLPLHNRGNKTSLKLLWKRNICKAFSTAYYYQLLWLYYEKYIVIIVIWTLHLCIKSNRNLHMVLSGAVVEYAGNRGITDNFKCYLSSQRLSLGYEWCSI